MQKVPYIDGFTFTKYLATLGRGEVWHAVQEKLEREVLVQIIKHDSPAVLANILRTVACIKCELLPEIVDIILEPWGVAIVCEDAHALPLLTLLRGQRLNAVQCISLGRKLAEGLRQLHLGHLVYCNLRPGSLYLTEDFEPVLLDYSLIQFEASYGENVCDDVLIASAYYAAPEQYMQPECVDTRADMFALGGTLYALGTGGIPFGKFSPEQAQTLKLTEKIASPCDISLNFPEGLARVLQRLCMPEAMARYHDWDEVLFDFHAASMGTVTMTKITGSMIAEKSTVRKGKQGKTIRLTRKNLERMQVDTLLSVLNEGWRWVFLGLFLLVIILLGLVLKVCL